MKRIDTLNARPDLFGVGKSGFHDNADLPGQDATYLNPDWLNTIQEELSNLLELNEVPLDHQNYSQLFNLLATKSQVLQLKNDLDVLLYSPIPWPLMIPPSGFLIMMGQSILQGIHPKLYSLYGATLKDMRSMFIRGVDNGRGIDVGRAILSEQSDEFKSHLHYDKAGIGGEQGVTNDLAGISTVYAKQYSNSGQHWVVPDGQVPQGAINGLFTTSAGGVETRPANIAYNYIVKAG